VEGGAAGGTIGNGSAASCNQTAFFAAFAGGAGGSIGFNCPPNTVITLSLGYQGIITPTTLDGSNNGNPVTLSGNNTNRLLWWTRARPFQPLPIFERSQARASRPPAPAAVETPRWG
jgi:hypothetical protein